MHLTSRQEISVTKIRNGYKKRSKSSLLSIKKFNYRIIHDNSMTRAIVLGGSRGMGKAISESLKSIKIDVFAA